MAGYTTPKAPKTANNPHPKKNNSKSKDGQPGTKIFPSKAKTSKKKTSRKKK